jgi:CIC family chloride channel protein
VLDGVTVADAMEPVPQAVREDATLSDLVDRFARDVHETLPVFDGTGAYRGIVTATEVEDAADSELNDVTAGDLARTIPALRSNQPLQDAVSTLLAGDQHGLPVMAADDRRIVGWLTHRDLLKAYSERSSASPPGAADGPLGE